MRKTILTATIVLLGTIGLFAQSQSITSGGNASGSGGTVGYTVGQAAYQTHSGAGGTVAEGTQQPYEIFTVTGIEHTEINIVRVSVYPNPVSDYLKLEVEIKNVEDLSFQLFNIQGKLLQTQKLTNSITRIDMNGYVASTYFAKVLSKNKSIKEFKIIKN